MLHSHATHARPGKRLKISTHRRGVVSKSAMQLKNSSSQQTLFACSETVLNSIFQPGVVLIFRYNSSLAVLRQTVFRHPTVHIYCKSDKFLSRFRVKMFYLKVRRYDTAVSKTIQRCECVCVRARKGLALRVGCRCIYRLVL